jgi:hypothetical protein
LLENLHVPGLVVAVSPDVQQLLLGLIPVVGVLLGFYAGQLLGGAFK